MKFITIEPVKDSLYQKITLNLPIGKETKRTSLELRYMEKTDRWYMSMYDLQTEEIYFRNVPLLASYGRAANNLLAPFWHKRIGVLACFPASDNVETENPSKDNLSDFYIVWGDGIVE